MESRNESKAWHEQWENCPPKMQFSLCWFLIDIHPFDAPLTTVACKRLRSHCEKCWLQVAAKHAHTFDPTEVMDRWRWCPYTMWELTTGKQTHMQFAREFSNACPRSSADCGLIFGIKDCARRPQSWCTEGAQLLSSGTVWKLKWPSWAPRP